MSDKKPFRIDVRSQCVASIETMKAQAAVNSNYPRVERCLRHGRKLAVVGGGPLVIHDLDELRSWDGDIWSINYTAQWLHSHGIESTLLSIDPQPLKTIARDALLASSCHPETAAAFAGRVRVFDLCETDESGIPGGVTTATRAPSLSFLLGYLDVSFFGCEGSFHTEWKGVSDGAGQLFIRDHVDRHDAPKAMVIIRADGADYCTDLELLKQCEQLVALFSAFPDVYHNRSGGLVKAMLRDPEWEVTAVSGALRDHIELLNGKSGLYEDAYQPIGT